MIEITYGNETKRIEITERRSILEMVREHFQCSFSPCVKAAGRAGTCGRCLVTVTENGKQRQALACHETARDGMQVKVCFAGKENTGFADDEAVGAAGSEDICHVNEEEGIAVDLGSTTIVMYYSGRYYRCMNPQRSYGSDVVSRMQASNEGKLQKLRDLTRAALEKGFHELAGNESRRVILAGNTTMIHLLMGYSCEQLGSYPFLPVSLKAEEWMLSQYHIKTVPGISTFVGGDILAGLYHIMESEKEKEQESNTFLLIDLGTNGEIVLKKGNTFYCTATAAGPAFEGDVTAKIPGSELVSLTASYLRRGMLDETGLFAEPYFTNGIQEGEALITQKIIRELQLAKAAVWIGVKTLLERAAVAYTEIERIYLAGGFGYYLSPEDAFTIGLLPTAFRGRVEAAGNTSLQGAVRLLGDTDGFCRLEKIREHCTVFNLAKETSFDDAYIAALSFGIQKEDDAYHKTE